MQAKHDIKEPKFHIDIVALASVSTEISISCQCEENRVNESLQPQDLISSQSSPYSIIVPSCRGKSLFHFRMRTQKFELKCWKTLSWIFLLSMERTENRFQREQKVTSMMSCTKVPYVWLQGCMLWQDEWEEWCHIAGLFFCRRVCPCLTKSFHLLEMRVR